MPIRETVQFILFDFFLFLYYLILLRVIQLTGRSCLSAGNGSVTVGYNPEDLEILELNSIDSPFDGPLNNTCFSRGTQLVVNFSGSYILSSSYPPGVRVTLNFGKITIATLPTIETLPDALAYNPAERTVIDPVPPLDLEFAMFIVAQKINHTELVKLCIPPPTYNAVGTSRLTRETFIQGCHLDSYPNTSKYIFGNVSTFPSKELSFEQIFPVNEKWGSEVDTDVEYLIDMTTTYFFDYASSTVDNAAKFTKNRPTQTYRDVNQYNQTKFFPVELDVLGKQFGWPQYPANPPVLNFVLNLTENSYETARIVQEAGTFLWFSNVLSWNPDVVFKDLVVEWPNSMPLILEPGWNYTFSATVTILPKNSIGVLGGLDITEWKQTYASLFEKAQSGYEHRNHANVRIIITFDRFATAENSVVEYRLIDFLSSLGSSVGLFTIGLVLLSLWQQCTLPEDLLKNTQTQKNIYHYLEDGATTVSNSSIHITEPSASV
jgi:hypothetical protein